MGDGTPVALGPWQRDRASGIGKKAIHIPDVLSDPEYQASGYQQAFGYRTILCVPLLREGITIGSFNLTRDEVNPFTDKQIELVTTFADQTVIAIENTRLFEAEQQRTRELSESLEQQTATSEVLQVISSSQGDLQPVFATILEKAIRICDAKMGGVYHWDGVSLHLGATYNLPPAYAELRRDLPFRPKPKSFLGSFVANKTMVYHSDLAADEAYIEQRDPYLVAAVNLVSRSHQRIPKSA
jgi:two-component system, NtrC family, sensor kinase